MIIFNVWGFLHTILLKKCDEFLSPFSCALFSLFKSDATCFFAYYKVKSCEIKVILNYFIYLYYIYNLLTTFLLNMYLKCVQCLFPKSLLYIIQNLIIKSHLRKRRPSSLPPPTVTFQYAFIIIMSLFWLLTVGQKGKLHKIYGINGIFNHNAY